MGRGRRAGGKRFSESIISMVKPAQNQGRGASRSGSDGAKLGRGAGGALTPAEVQAELGIGATLCAELIFWGAKLRGVHPLRGGFWPVYKVSAKARRIPRAALRAHLDHVERVGADAGFRAAMRARLAALGLAGARYGRADDFLRDEGRMAGEVATPGAAGGSFRRGKRKNLAGVTCAALAAVPADGLRGGSGRGKRGRVREVIEPGLDGSVTAGEALALASGRARLAGVREF